MCVAIFQKRHHTPPPSAPAMGQGEAQESCPRSVKGRRVKAVRGSAEENGRLTQSLYFQGLSALSLDLSADNEIETRNTAKLTRKAMPLIKRETGIAKKDKTATVPQGLEYSILGVSSPTISTLISASITCSGLFSVSLTTVADVLLMFLFPLSIRLNANDLCAKVTKKH